MPHMTIRKSQVTKDLYAELGLVIREPWKFDPWVWTGTEEDEVQKARLGPVIFDGRGGRDSLQGGLFADELRGGSGDDTVSGSDGDDRVFGDNGSDRLIGGNGHDSVWGGEGRDHIRHPLHHRQGGTRSKTVTW